MRNHFEKKEYDEAKQLAQTLHKKFNGTSEDQQASKSYSRLTRPWKNRNAQKRQRNRKLPLKRKKNARDKAGRLSGFLKFIRGRPIQRGVSIYISYGRTCPTKRSNMLILRRFPLSCGRCGFCEIRRSSTFYGQEPALMVNKGSRIVHISHVPDALI